MNARTYSWLVAGVLASCFGLTPVRGQVITTVAGTDWSFPPSPLPALNAPLGSVYGVVVDTSGNVYVSDPGNQMVMRISPDGKLTVVAGNGIPGFSGDGGPATSASLNGPEGLALDSAGNLYIVDHFNQRVREVSGGTITTVAGNGMAGFSGDGGPATSAALSFSTGVAVDLAGNLYIADAPNARIRKVSGGIITTVAGNGMSGFSGDEGLATNASFNNPTAVAVDAAGDLYILDAFNYCVRKVSGGIITTVTGNRQPGFGFPEGFPDMAEGLAVDSVGNIFVADAVSDRILMAAGGAFISVAGSSEGFSGDGGPATSASLGNPAGVTVDATGSLYIADTSNGRVRKVDSGGIIQTLAGNGFFRSIGDGGLAVSAPLGNPYGVTVDSSGNLYIADSLTNRIRKVSGGTITTVAGNGASGSSGDGGPATKASLRAPEDVAVDRDGNLYIADTDNHRIRKVTGGIITTVAGNGNQGFFGDGGPATSAWLNYPSSVALDSSGNIYLNAGIGRIREVSGGTITTVAGNGMFQSSGDNGPATSASLGIPTGVALDAANNLYIAEDDGSIRKVSNGIITTVVGEAGMSTSLLDTPQGVTVDAAGNLYIADTFHYRVLKLSGGIVTTVAGNGTMGFSGDGGPATSAALNAPWDVAVDSAGNVYIADEFNSRIRAVLAKAPAIQTTVQSLAFSGRSDGAVTSKQSLPIIASVTGVNFVISADAPWLQLSSQNGSTPGLIEVFADPSGLPPQTYSANVRIAAPDANPTSITIPVTFAVSPAQPAALAPLDPRNFAFSFAKSTPAQSQRLTISNAGGGTLSFTATAAVATPAGAQWLTLSATSGQATPGSPAILTVTADPTGLGIGTFAGTIHVTSGATTMSVPVTITVSALDQAILLSQRGLFFTAVAQGGVVPPQTFAVRNIGTGVINWTAKAVLLPATLDWLSVSPTSGSTDAAQSPPNVTVTVNPSGLAEGTYYGLVQVEAPAAANSPQVLTVVLQVLKAGTDVGAALTPGSLLFTATAGASSPGSQNVLVYNLTANAKSFRSVVSADPGLTLVTLPTDATLDPQNPTPIVVQPFTTSLGPGIYTGTITLQFDDGRVRSVTVKVIVSSSGAVSSAGNRARSLDTSGGCAPTKLQPILTAPQDAFEGFTGFGVKLGVFVKDDCGVPLQTGSVKVSFSNGDTTSTLQPLQGGLWEGTWYTRNPSANVNLKVHAENPQLGISGDLQTNGSLASQQPPTFDDAGIVSIFGGATFAPLAPGEVISIAGSNLAETSVEAPGFPLSTTLADTSVTIQGRPLPLYYVEDQLIYAVVPYSLTTTSLNAPLQILVQRGNTLSQPVYVTVATAEPTIFSGTDAITSYPANGGSPYSVTAATPAHAGDTLSIYCLGLGAVDPPVADGATPPAGVSLAAPVQVLVGNQTARVTFQGLTQSPGLYLVSAVIPAGVPTGSSVPVTVSSGGQTSPPVQIPIQ